MLHFTRNKFTLNVLKNYHNFLNLKGISFLEFFCVKKFKVYTRYKRRNFLKHKSIEIFFELYCILARQRMFRSTLKGKKDSSIGTITHCILFMKKSLCGLVLEAKSYENM